MPCYAFEGRIPVVHPTSFLHPLASLIGDVIVGPGCYIGPAASLRGDFGRILVTGDASVQDGCVLHGSAEQDCVVGRGATIGHAAVLHGCVIGENVLVGIGATVLDAAEIGDDCLVAAQTLVRGGQRFAPRGLIAGNPARLLRLLGAEEVTWRNDGDGEYQRLARRSLAGLVPCAPLPEPEPDRKRNEGNARPVRLGRGRKD
ncbi:MAG: phenylacetic acid degradation protein PaaY [Rhodovulum sulfidophilum]|uniref:Phenylacetic acid degradation protein PaaY n=1 Tax=Rhodovulum sulfidophilum TaxID=35806 RepID=A0A2W5Q4X4_RHOSU|nr:MAG: phenylacetic acid degradation protein PaaY [Rhodovulum sulfidophilum]